MVSFVRHVSSPGLPAVPDPDQFLAQVPLAWVIPGVLGGLVLLVVVAVRLRPAPPGHATSHDLRAEMSARSARQLLPQTRPSLVGQQDVAVTEYAVRIGRAVAPRRGVYGTPEDTYLIIGPPGAYKTTWLDNVIADAPGPVIHTSTKIADHLSTVDLREQVGPVYRFNPSLLGGLANTLQWSPIDGCEVPRVAIDRAGYLLYGARTSGDAPLEEFFRSTANEVLRAYLHAAALGGQGMADVYRWVGDPDNTEALVLLQHHEADPAWISTLQARQSVTDRTRDGIYTTLGTALSWLADPDVMRAVTPAPGAPRFDAETFLRSKGTLYLIAEESGTGVGISPLFVALTAHLVDASRQVAAAMPGRRLDPYLTLALDEMANICPVPVDRWIAQLRALGVMLLGAIQSKSQLRARWGEAGASTIWNAAAWTLILRGIKDADDLESLSKACGDYPKRSRSSSHGPHGTTSSTSTQDAPTMPPGKIRMLGRRRILALYRGSPPVLIVVRGLWMRRDIRKRRRAIQALDAASPRPSVVVPDSAVRETV